MSNAGWCCSYEDGNGLWYTDEYPEEVFFDHWFWMAERYRHNPLVIGADLRNEIRGILGKIYYYKKNDLYSRVIYVFLRVFYKVAIIFVSCTMDRKVSKCSIRNILST